MAGKEKGAAPTPGEGRDVHKISRNESRLYLKLFLFKVLKGIGDITDFVQGKTLALVLDHLSYRLDYIPLRR